MIGLIQRVNWSRLTIGCELHAEINAGLLALVGIEKEDSSSDVDKLLRKLLCYRIFADEEGKMNLGLKETGGELLLVSQFTLAASTSKGLRPGFSSAKPPDQAERLFDELVTKASQNHGTVQSGVFGADMQIALENNGPVTFLLRS